MLETFYIEQSRKLPIKDQKQQNETKQKRIQNENCKRWGEKKEKVQPAERSFPQQDHNQTQCCKIHMIFNY